MSQSTQVAIVGAGAAGLATARALAARGLRPVIFEAGHGAGESWRRRYDRLRLHTGRRLSGQPGSPIPRGSGPWVAATDFADYLERYAARHGLEVVRDTEVRSVRRSGAGWRLDTDRGAREAQAVVLAAGYCRMPHWPDGLRPGSFDGLLLHSSDYRNPGPFAGCEVLVVGCGNSGAEIATELALGGARQVRLAIRSGPSIVPRAVLGVPTHALAILLAPLPADAKDAIGRLISRLWLGDLRRSGLPAPTRGLFARIAQDRVAPVLDSGFVAALRAGRIEIVASVEGIAGREVRLADGTVLTPDAIVAATGFEPALDELLGPGVALSDRGLPQLTADFEAVDAPGLYLAGYLLAAEGVLWAIARQSSRIATAIARHSQEARSTAERHLTAIKA